MAFLKHNAGGIHILLKEEMTLCHDHIFCQVIDHIIIYFSETQSNCDFIREM